MKKTFILDTNVLLHDPKALFAFDDNDVVVPIYCIEEIDQFKRDLSELGRNARQVSRILDGFRAKGNLGEGVRNDRGGLMRVLFSERNLPKEMGNQGENDSRILAVALDVRDSEAGASAIFVTKDTNLRIRADALGLTAEDFDSERVEISDLYTGITELPVAGNLIDAFYKNGESELPSGVELFSNQYVLLKDESNPSHSAMGKVNGQRARIVPLLRSNKEGVWGIRPRNMEQSFALDLLLNDDIKMVTMVGKAGTGKTLLAIAAGLHKTMEEGIFHKLLVSRPIFPLGRDIGYLPGDVEQKLNPWMQPIFDNVEFLMNLSRAEKRAGRSYTELMDLGILEIEPLTYIRGRSIPNQFIIVDEAQNLTPHEVKTIITRAGDGTKIVLTGDPYQIDNPYVDSTNNGLVHVVNRFKQEKIAGHITMSKGERSELAELAANLL
ncbi:MAG: PhoH family protein [Deltaproteobacteria bacterium]|nr:PhoH family protein [Deltaproteobacteria bacterium]